MTDTEDGDTELEKEEENKKEEEDKEDETAETRGATAAAGAEEGGEIATWRATEEAGAETREGVGGRLRVFSRANLIRLRASTA